MKRHILLLVLGITFIISSIRHWLGAAAANPIFSSVKWAEEIIYIVFFVVGLASAASFVLFLLKRYKPAKMTALTCLGAYILYTIISAVVMIAADISLFPSLLLVLAVLLFSGALFYGFYVSSEANA